MSIFDRRGGLFDVFTFLGPAEDPALALLKQLIVGYIPWTSQGILSL